VRKTTKLIEGGHRGIQDYRHIYFYFFYVFTFFQIQKVVTFYVFLPCFVRFLELWCVSLSFALVTSLTSTAERAVGAAEARSVCECLKKNVCALRRRMLFDIFFDRPTSFILITYIPVCVWLCNSTL